jgi:hypothetical protein
MQKNVIKTNERRESAHFRRAFHSLTVFAFNIEEKKTLSHSSVVDAMALCFT